MSSFEVVIGLEVHVQIRTESKMFCSCPNVYGAEPNTLICPICLGYPGALPSANASAIKKTIIAGLMCDCQIATFSKFDRKSYFYPDMPKNYQITQYDFPFCSSGKLEISGRSLSGNILEPKIIGITRIHLEEDVGKSTHFDQYSCIDYNRAGVALMEIVSEPEMASADEAYLYLVAMKQVMQYAGISDCDMEKGQMRCDVNISLKPSGMTTLNPKTELKNLNSFKAAHRAINYEIERQTRILDDEGQLVQETRGWNDDNGESYSLRSKESAHDYRYFPEPDLIPLSINTQWIESIRANLPETPLQIKERFIRDYHLSSYDAGVLTSDLEVAAYFEKCVIAGALPKSAANWIMVELLREMSECGKPFSQCPVLPGHLAELLDLIEKNTINGRIAKTVFIEMFTTAKAPGIIIEDKGLTQVTDLKAIDIFVQQAMVANPGPVSDFRNGKQASLQFLIGQVMKISRGKANPQLAAERLYEMLKNE